VHRFVFSPRFLWSFPQVNQVLTQLCLQHAVLVRRARSPPGTRRHRLCQPPRRLRAAPHRRAARRRHPPRRQLAADCSVLRFRRPAIRQKVEGRACRRKHVRVFARAREVWARGRRIRSWAKCEHVRGALSMQSPPPGKFTSAFFSNDLKLMSQRRRIASLVCLCSRR
jgi:hypothetical protein